MRNASFRRRITVLVLVLALTLAAPWAAAAAPIAGPPDLLGRLWQLVVSLWSDSGCHIDPNGHCRDTATPEPPATGSGENGDIGCHIDPSGGCGG